MDIEPRAPSPVGRLSLFYGDPITRKSFTVTTTSAQALEAAARQTGISQSNLVDALVAAGLTDDFLQALVRRRDNKHGGQGDGPTDEGVAVPVPGV